MYQSRAEKYHALFRKQLPGVPNESDLTKLKKNFDAPSKSEARGHGKQGLFYMALGCALSCLITGAASSLFFQKNHFQVT